MRRRTMLGLLTVTALSGCSQQDDRPASPTPSLNTPQRIERLTQEAAALTKGMVEGNFQPIIDRGTEQLQQAADASALETAWRQVSEPRGKVVDLAGAGLLKQQQGMTLIVVIINLEQGRLAVQYVFDEEDRIGGFHFRDPLPADEAAIGQGGEESSSYPSYPAEEVSVGEHALTGEYLTPAPDATPLPVTAILLAGSGPADMDGKVGGTRILKDLAWGLAAAGISSLRYNKRYYEQPQLDHAVVTLGTEVLDDFGAALELVKGLPGSAGHRIVVIGHSLGGTLVPHILASHADLAGGVILAGSPRHLAEILRDQLIRQLGEGEDTETQRTAIEAEADSARSITGGSEFILGLPRPYWESVTRIHGSLADDLAAAGDPVLILHGDDDGQLPVGTDYEPWADVALGPAVERNLFPGLNHLLMPTAETKGNLDYVTPNTLSPEVVTTITDWLQRRVMI